MEAITFIHLERIEDIMNVPRLSTLPSEMFDYLWSLKFHHSAESSKRAATLSLHLFLFGFGKKKNFGTTLRQSESHSTGNIFSQLKAVCQCKSFGCLKHVFMSISAKIANIFPCKIRGNTKHSGAIETPRKLAYVQHYRDP